MADRAASRVNVLIVDDDPADVDLTLEALKDAKLRNTFHVARDGIECLEFLRKEGPHADAPTPDVILLDLNMPRMSGLEALQQIRSDPKLKSIPVVVLTTSDADRDILASYELAANCYVTKPVDFDQFEKVVRSIEEFWFEVVRLPKRTE